VLTLFCGGGAGVFVSSSECQVFCAGHRNVIGCIFVISYRDNPGYKTKNYAFSWRMLNEYDIAIHSDFVSCHESILILCLIGKCWSHLGRDDIGKLFCSPLT
jgi:hypothetical protein